MVRGRAALVIVDAERFSHNGWHGLVLQAVLARSRPGIPDRASWDVLTLQSTSTDRPDRVRYARADVGRDCVRSPGTHPPRAASPATPAGVAHAALSSAGAE